MCIYIYTLGTTYILIQYRVFAGSPRRRSVLMATSMRSRSSKRELIFFYLFCHRSLWRICCRIRTICWRGERSDSTHQMLVLDPTFCESKSCLYWENFPEIPIPKTPITKTFKTQQNTTTIQQRMKFSISFPQCQLLAKPKWGLEVLRLHWIWVLPTHSTGGVCSISPKT